MTQHEIVSPSDAKSDARPASNRPRYAVLVVAAIVLLLVGAGTASCLGRFLAPRPAPSPPPPSTVTVIRPTSQVLIAVRDLSHLEGAEYHMERVVDLREQQSRFFGLVHTEDAILLVAAGDVTAGVDLSALREGDVVVDMARREATIVLPRPKVLSTRLDNQRTYVHTRNTGVLAHHQESLETQARQEAERTLEQAAVLGGVLERAQRNAERTVETLVRSLGYTRVSVRTRRPEE